MQRIWLKLAAPILIVMAACSDNPAGTPQVDRVDVGPAGRTIEVGDSLELTAAALTSTGEPVEGVVLWRSTSPQIATVRASGNRATVVAVSEGAVRIEAESGGRTGHVDVVIAPLPQIGSVVVEPYTVVVEANAEVGIRAEVRSVDGVLLNNRTITWTVEPAGVVEVVAGQNGWATVRGIAAGEATISATAGGAQGQAWTQVVATAPPPRAVASVAITPGTPFTLPVNHETTIQAVARDADGMIVSGHAVTWVQSVPGVVEIVPIPSSPFARIRAAAPGMTGIRAVIGGVVSEVAVTVPAVVPPPQQVLYLFFDTQKRGIWRGQFLPQRNELVALGSNGPVQDAAIVWEVEDAAVATIDSAGVLRGIARGTTRVIARHNGLTAYRTVTVFEGVGPTAVFDLTWDWWDDQMHLPPAIATEKYTDANGVQHDVSVYPTAGTLTLQSTGEYRRVLRVEGWAYTSTGPLKVIDRDIVDEGMSTIIVGGETGYTMISTTTPGYTWQVVTAYNAGHVRMRAVVGEAPLHEYMLRLRQ